ncbi:MAG: hypothetical protein ACM3SR_16450 [Ignavibacteriales bacterium]
MKKISPKPLVRRFVLATSFPPFLQIYRFFYEIVTRMALRIFKKYPEIKAAYLRRGGGKGEILPLLSDLDFAVIEERMNEEDKKSLRRSYERLARATTVLDQSLEVYDEEVIYKHYESKRRRYRIIEGKETWKLLYGKDYLSDLPALPLEELYGGIYNEITVWWTLFMWRLLQVQKNLSEEVIQNSVCYKAVSEILKMDLAFNHGVLTFSRSEALERAKAYLYDEERTLVEKLETIARKRFLINNAGIVEETKDFLLNYLDRFCKEFRAHNFVQSLKAIPQRVDCSVEEQMLSVIDRDHVRRLLDYVKEKWSHTYLGAYLVSGFYFDLDELALMVEVDPERLPTLQELAAFYLLHCNMQSELRSRLHLYLLLPHAAFRIDVDYGKGWQSILCPSSTPDLFELLGRSEFSLSGGGYQPATSSTWTPLAKDFLQERKRDFYERLQSPEIYSLNSLDFLKMFWKTVQLVLINRSAQRDEILYPLTLLAVERTIVTEGIPFPTHLQFLADAYRDELNGKSWDISKLIPEAITYLKEIEHECSITL